MNLALLALPAILTSPLPAHVQDGAVEAGSTVTQEAPAPDPLAKFGRLVGGQWRPVDLGILNEYSRYRYGAGGKSVLLTTWRIGEDGLDPAASHGILYWDPARNTIAGTVVLEGGQVKEMKVDLSDDARWDFHYDYHSGGAGNRMLDTIGWDDENTYTFQMFFVGETPLEWIHMRCAREEEGGSALPLMPMDDGSSAHLGALEPLTGNWATKTVTADGTTTEGRTVIYWGLDRTMVVFRSLEQEGGEEVPRTDGFFYWTSETSGIRSVAVDAEGAVYRGSLAPAAHGLTGDFLQLGVEGRFTQEFDFPGADEGPGFTVRTYRKDGDERTLLQTTTLTPAD